MAADFTPIIRDAIEQARRVKATPQEFRDGLESWKDEIDEEVQASEDTDEGDDED